MSGRVAVNATILGERPTGLGVYALGLLAALAERGERLTVITSYPDGLPRSASVERAPGGIRPERGAAGHFARLAWQQTVLPLRLARSRPEVLLNVMPEGPLVATVPQVTIVHDLIPLFFPARRRFPRSYLYFRHVVPRLLGISRAVLTNSERTRRDVLAQYPNVDPARVHVVYAGYDAERFRPVEGRPPDPPYFVFVGNVAPHKNLVRLVEAFADVARTARVRLFLRGSGAPWHERPLRERIAALGVADRVDWRPYEPFEGLPALYSGARALILPSLYEGFGFTALEAMACGTPVIAARATSIPEVVGDAALLFDPTDTEALASAMSRVLADDALAADLRERGPRRAALFSWERTAALVRPHMSSH